MTCKLFFYPALFYGIVDVFTYTPEISVDRIIGNAKDHQAVLLQKGCPDRILSLILILVMLGTIQFNYKLRCCTVKVSDILSEYLLPGKPSGMGAEVVIPEVPFFLRHILTKLPCKGDKLLVLFGLHCVTSQGENPEFLSKSLPCAKGGGTAQP